MRRQCIREWRQSISLMKLLFAPAKKDAVLVQPCVREMELVPVWINVKRLLFRPFKRGKWLFKPAVFRMEVCAILTKQSSLFNVSFKRMLPRWFVNNICFRLPFRHSLLLLLWSLQRYCLIRPLVIWFPFRSIDWWRLLPLPRRAKQLIIIPMINSSAQGRRIDICSGYQFFRAGQKNWYPFRLSILPRPPNKNSVRTSA